MNLSQLRKLVKETKHLPANTVLVTRAKFRTYEELADIRPVQVLAFQQPRSQCPLGMLFHPIAAPEEFGCRSEAELADRARVETVLEVI